METIKEYAPIILGLINFIGIVLVWNVQKSQINEQKEIGNSLKDFHSIFDIKKVRDYTELMQERDKIKNEDFILKTVIPMVTKQTIEGVMEHVMGTLNHTDEPKKP